MSAKKRVFENIAGEAIITPPAIAAFIGGKNTLAKPDTGHQYSSNKFQVQLLFDKDDADLSDIARVCEDLIEQAWPGEGLTLADIEFQPFQDGDEIQEKRKDNDPEAKPLAGFDNKVIITPKTQFPPDIIDAQKKIILADEIYSGCWVRALIQPLACMPQNKKCITFYLQAVQKLKDGPRLGSGIASAQDVFQAWADDEDEKKSSKAVSKAKSASKPKEDEEEEGEVQQKPAKKKNGSLASLLSS